MSGTSEREIWKEEKQLSQRSSEIKEGSGKFNNNTTDKRTPRVYLKKARKFLKQRYEANHASEPDYLKDDNMVLNLAYFNYAKANKLKDKASNCLKF